MSCNSYGGEPMIVCVCVCVCVCACVTMSIAVSMVSAFFRFWKKKKPFPPWKLQHLNSSSQLSLNFCCSQAFSVTAGVVGPRKVQQWLLPNSPQTQKIVFFLSSASKVAKFLDHGQHRACMHTHFSARGSTLAHWLSLAHLSHTSDVSDRTSSECNSLQAWEKNNQKLCPNDISRLTFCTSK